MDRRIKQIHFVGIGGIGMSGIAEVLLNQGYSVSGSDLKSSKTTTRLESIGAKVLIGHKPKNVGDAEVVVISSAVKEDNPEVREARRIGLPVIPRAEMLAELMRYKQGIAVAGSHGKTTTTTLIATVLSTGGFDPTIVVGGRVGSLGSNARLGKGEYMVVEADESDGTFLMLSPTISVITNIDREHMDHYKNLDNLKEAFLGFANKPPFYGLSVVCVDSPNLESLIPKISKRVLTYGFSDKAELRAHGVSVAGFETRFNVSINGEELGRLILNLPGKHNALNALAAVAVGMELGMSFDEVAHGLSEFKGIDRRLELKGEGKGVSVYDDYGHHPEEIRVTLEALKQSFPSSRLIVVFQPHRYSRTKLLMDEFADALSKSDILFILDIFPAGEKPIEGVNSSVLRDRVAGIGHKNSHYVSDSSQIVKSIKEVIESGDVVLTLGAGNVWKIAEEITEDIIEERR